MTVVVSMALTGWGKDKPTDASVETTVSSEAATETSTEDESTEESTQEPTKESTAPSKEPSQPASSEAAEPGYTVDKLDQTMYATNDVKLRKGPSTEYDAAGMLKQGQEVKVTGKVEGWYRVDIDGEVFVSAKYLSDKAPEKVVVKKPGSDSSASNTQSNTGGSSGGKNDASGQGQAGGGSGGNTSNFTNKRIKYRGHL